MTQRHNLDPTAAQEAVEQRKRVGDIRRQEAIAAKAGKVAKYVFKHASKGETIIPARAGRLRIASIQPDVYEQTRGILADQGFVTSLKSIYMGSLDTSEDYIIIDRINPSLEVHSQLEVETQPPHHPLEAHQID